MKNQNILVLTYWSFKDPLIQTYTLPYIKIIHKILPESKIYLFTLEKTELRLSKEEKEKATKDLRTFNIEWIESTYVSFGITAIISWTWLLTKLTSLILFKTITFIHCWCTPAGAAGYILATITGRKLIIDSYEPHAEAMVENGTWSREGFAFRLLFKLEKLQSKKAFAVISATEGMKEYSLAKYGVEHKNFMVKPACVDLQLFSEANLKKQSLLDSMHLNGKIVCVYAGKLGGIYLDREVFDFLKVCEDHWGESFRTLLLSPHSHEEIELRCKQIGLDSRKIILMSVPHAQVADYLGLGDFAITPVKPVPTKKYCTPIKDGEYWALGLPVVIPANISDDSLIIEGHHAGVVLHEFGPEEYHKAVIHIDEIVKKSRSEVYAQIRPLAEKYRSFDIAKIAYTQVYLKIV